MPRRVSSAAGTEVDLTDKTDKAFDDAAPADYPVLVFLRDEVRRLRTENRDLRAQAIAERARADELAPALNRERRLTTAADAELKRLHRRIARLESRLSKLLSQGQDGIEAERQGGIRRRARRIFE